MKTYPRRRVLMLLENNPYLTDGRVKNEANALTRAGYHVTVVSPRAPGHTAWVEDVQGVRVFGFPPTPEMDGFLGYIIEYGYATLIMSILSIVALVRGGVDIVHAHNPPDTFFWLGFIFKLIGKKFVFDQHDLAPEMYDARSEALDGKPGNPLVRRALALMERFTCQAANRIISTNESYKARAIELYAQPAEKFTIVRNGPNPDKFKLAEPDARLRQQARYLIGYVGLMGPQDGVDYLISALGHLVNDLGRRDVLCVVMGDGPALPALKQLAEELKIGPQVSFTGRVSQEAVVRYLSSVDVCVCPDPKNAYNDRSTMIKVMEYMALSRPTVAFDLCENRASAGDAGVYAQPNDVRDMAREIALLLDDPARRERMGRLGRERVETQLAWHFQETQLLSLYADLTGKANASSEAERDVRKIIQSNSRV